MNGSRWQFQLRSQDDTVLILGASGGAGTARVLIEKFSGAQVFACASTADKLSRLSDLGPHIPLRVPIEITITVEIVKGHNMLRMYVPGHQTRGTSLDLRIRLSRVSKGT